MKKGLLKLVAFSVLVVTLASCAKAPQAEIDAANVAIEAAKTAGADRYVPESFNAASEALKTAVTAVEEQNSKFALFLIQRMKHQLNLMLMFCLINQLVLLLCL